VSQGEVVGLIGPNGAGKTTLIKALSGIQPVKAGSARIQGKDLFHMPARERASRLAVVPQARSLPADFTVWQTVLMGRTPYLGWLGTSSRQDNERASWALARTSTLQLADRPIGELSGGEQQRVLLARALAQDAPVLLLDEPTTYMDLKHQSILLKLVYELAHDHGIAVMMVLHDLNLVALHADRVALLVDGKLRALGTPGEVITPERLSEAYDLPLKVIPHPEYGTPLILPQGMTGREF
jgi:iron complex transport system ATP-binding protein